MENVQVRYDAVVIGSGVGGLSCAAFLGMCNKKVLVLEKNAPGEGGPPQTVIRGETVEEVPIPRDIGGCLQTIAYDKWSWNLGLQYQAPFSCYLGPFYMKEAEIIPLITDPPVQLKSLDEVYQLLRFPEFGEDAVYKIYSDGDKMRDYLSELFPSQADALKRYWEYINVTDRYTYPIMITKVLPPFLAKFLYPVLTQKLKPILDKTYDQVLDDLFDLSDDGVRVRALLNAYWNVLGMPLDSNFLFWTMSDNQLFHGISAPDGGSKALVDGLLGTIRKNGGELRFGAAGTVSKVLVTGGARKKVSGVLLEDQTRIDADIVVSTVGLPDTVGPLVPKEEVSRRVRKTVPEHINVPSSLILRVGLDLNRDQLDALNIVEKKTYRTMTGRPWDYASDPTKEGWVPDDVMVIFPAYYYTEPGDPRLQTVEVVHITNYQKYFAKYDGPDDPAFKIVERRIMNTLREHLEKEFPALAPHIACMMLTSPMTLKEQIYHKDASMYGIDAYRTIDPAVQSRTGIKGFYMSGEDTFVNGVTIATGLITAGCILADECLRAAPGLLARLLLQMPRLILDFISGDPRVKLPDDIRRRLT